MDVVDGDREVSPGAVVQLHASYGDWQAGAPDHCVAHWYVNYIEGGSHEVGTIDRCGRYQAPAAFPPGLALLGIEASEYVYDGCADCCPYAYIELYPRP